MVEAPAFTGTGYKMAIYAVLDIAKIQGGRGGGARGGLRWRAKVAIADATECTGSH